jgi:hypothetical protein
MKELLTVLNILLALLQLGQFLDSGTEPPPTEKPPLPKLYD